MDKSYWMPTAIVATVSHMDTQTTQNPPIRLPTVQLEIRGDELIITPAGKPAAEVRISLARLDRWAAKIYRDEVLA
jgi:hypothetical protein